jgi:hypothetical protein
MSQGGAAPIPHRSAPISHGKLSTGFIVTVCQMPNFFPHIFKHSCSAAQAADALVDENTLQMWATYLSAETNKCTPICARPVVDDREKVIEVWVVFVQCKEGQAGSSTKGMLAPGSILYYGAIFLKCRSPFSSSRYSTLDGFDMPPTHVTGWYENSLRPLNHAMNSKCLLIHSMR